METSLMQCLDFAKLSQLPTEWDRSAPFKKAIALVAKYDGTSNYAIANMVDGYVNITKDFGSPAIIKSIVCYPYEYENKPEPAKKSKKK